MKKYISPFICGFGAGVMQIVPVAKSFACCFIIPLASFFALLLDQRANKSTEQISMRKAVKFGLITGLYAALFGTVFDIFITLVTKNNDIIAMFTELQIMVNSFPIAQDVKNDVLNLFQRVREDIIAYGFSPLYSFSILINNLIVDSIFGIVGGLIGAQIINKRFNKPVE